MHEKYIQGIIFREINLLWLYSVFYLSVLHHKIPVAYVCPLLKLKHLFKYPIPHCYFDRRHITQFKIALCVCRWMTQSYLIMNRCVKILLFNHQMGFIWFFRGKTPYTHSCVLKNKVYFSKLCWFIVLCLSEIGCL